MQRHFFYLLANKIPFPNSREHVSTVLKKEVLNFICLSRLLFNPHISSVKSKAFIVLHSIDAQLPRFIQHY